MHGEMKDAVPASRHLKLIRKLRELKPVPPDTTKDCPICKCHQMISHSTPALSLKNKGIKEQFLSLFIYAYIDWQS